MDSVPRPCEYVLIVNKGLIAVCTHVYAAVVECLRARGAWLNVYCATCVIFAQRAGRHMNVYWRREASIQYPEYSFRQPPNGHIPALIF